MKKLLSMFICLAMLFAMSSAFADVQLTMGSWRIDDTEKVQAMLDKYAEISGVKIKFEGTQSSQYNANLRLQLENGTGPDLYYARSYKTGIELFENGFAMDCTNIKGVMENFTDGSRDPWQTPDGKMFAVPFAAVSQVIYYNTKMFEELNLQVPNTWEEFMTVCKTLKDAGKTPLANGIADKWDVLECVFLGMLPNYIGGVDGRKPYETGEKKMNDEAFTKAIADFATLAQYLPDGFQAIGNNDANALFGTEQAAMLIDGSWSGGTIGESFGLEHYGAFAFPVPDGGQKGMCFHPDFAITGNPATQHKEEVEAFLTWLASPEGAQIAADSLPVGFFPMINAPIKINSEIGQDILNLNEGRVTDARMIWAKLLDAYNVMQDELIKLWLNETTVEEVANAFANAQAEILANNK